MEFNLTGLIIKTIVTLWSVAWFWLVLCLIFWAAFTIYRITDDFTKTDDDVIRAVKEHKGKVISIVLISFLFISFATLSSTFRPRITAGNIHSTTTNQLTNSLRERKTNKEVKNTEREKIADKINKDIQNDPDPFDAFRKQREGLK
jgi:hypothetical protein